jgi:S1-C subfamily serine protease
VLRSCGLEQPTPAPTIVHVAADRCGLVETSGTGFVVDGDLVMTAAHTLKGAGGVTVDGVAATLLASDVRSDVAVLSVSALDGGRAAFGSAVDGHRAQVLLRHSGQDLILAATVQSTPTIRLTDAPTDTTYVRDGLILDVDVDGGDSGAPVIDASHRVIGMVFAASRGDAPRTYAVASSEFDSVIAAARDAGETIPFVREC